MPSKRLTYRSSLCIQKRYQISELYIPEHFEVEVRKVCDVLIHQITFLFELAPGSATNDRNSRMNISLYIGKQGCAVQSQVLAEQLSALECRGAEGRFMRTQSV